MAVPCTVTPSRRIRGTLGTLAELRPPDVAARARVVPVVGVATLVAEVVIVRAPRSRRSAELRR